MVLICEMCGASLNANEAINDIIVCEYCDVATNIHGFVHLNMSSDQKAAGLMKRGFVLIEFKVWDKAKYVLKKAVEYDPKNARAYLGLLMVDAKCTKEEQLSKHTEKLSDFENYHKTLKYADVELKARLEGYNDAVVEKLRQEKLKREEQQRRWDKAKQEREEKWQKIEEEMKEARRKFRKKASIVAVPVLLIIITLIIIGRNNSAANLENLATFTDLYSFVNHLSP